MGLWTHASLPLSYFQDGIKHRDHTEEQKLEDSCWDNLKACGQETTHYEFEIEHLEEILDTEMPDGEVKDWIKARIEEAKAAGSEYIWFSQWS